MNSRIVRLASFVVCLVVIALSAGLTPSDRSNDDSDNNLVQNASVEDVVDGLPLGWERLTWSGEPIFEIENQFAHSGDRCVKISSTTGADASWSFRVSVKPNRTYRVSAWIKTENVAAGGFGAQLNLHELQMEGKTQPIRGTNDWTQVSSEFESSAHRKLTLNLLFGGWGRATGTAWFDDVQCEEVKVEDDFPEMSPLEAKEFFEAKVLPVLKTNCFKCHGAGQKIRGDFVLTNRDDLLTGGESGEAIDLDDPEESLLLSAINYDSYEMPPSGKLSKSDIEIITRWIHMGVPWKGEGFKPDNKPAEFKVPEVNEETKKWWSYNKPIRHTIPKVDSNWPANPIDNFILSKLQARELEPNPPASKLTLIRRAYYDLIGLPPTPQQVTDFIHDESPDAYEKLIDQLLASNQYGEKWGTHWLDLVRYAESNSYERDGTKPFVWRYRDYVIRSLNDDKPYDEFIREQLAGDEMGDFTPDGLIATGYFRLGKWDDEPVDAEQAWFDDMDDVLSTTGVAFLGMTIGCARCHDHKIDPIPQTDYYSMLAFFRNVQRYGVRDHDTVLRQSTRPIVPEAEQNRHSEGIERYERQVKQNLEALQKIEELVKKDFIPVEHEEFKHEMNRVPLAKKRIGKKIGDVEFTSQQAEEYEKLFEEMNQLRREKPKDLEAALCVTELPGPPAPTYVQIRGNAHAPGPMVQPAFPSVLSPPDPIIEPPQSGKTSGRRLALANWIAGRDNPLTARVMANRIWQHHFGRGLVRSSNDFGFQGIQPTHPQLLDWLANEFVDGGWKLKRMHKLIMMSNTYRMSSAANEQSLAKDAVNDLFWRFDMRRLTAGEIRDSILAINESLNKEKMYGPSIFPQLPQEVLDGQSRPGENWGNSSAGDLARRSIYIHIKRSLPVPLLATFDVADTDSSCPVRFNTVQPTQALTMLNSQFVNEQAEKFAKSAVEHESDNLEKQVEWVLRQVMQRSPTPAEIEHGTDFVGQLREGGSGEHKSLALFCVVALNLNEFLYLD